MHEPLDSSSCHSPHRPGLVPLVLQALVVSVNSTSASKERVHPASAIHVDRAACRINDATDGCTCTVS